MPSNVRVAVRVRPMLPNEQSAGHKQTFLDVDSQSSQISVAISQREVKQFRFDKIIDEKLTQQQVFEQLQIPGLVSKVLGGFHATVFAYGQTGSGKTYTMEGYSYEDRAAGSDERAGKPIINDLDTGLSVRAIREIFAQVEDIKDKTITLSVSFLQIYNEKIYDLLNKAQFKSKRPGEKDQGLKMRWSKTEQFSVENLFVFRCNDADHAIQLYNKGIKNKVVAAHNLNHASSRSHAIFTLQAEITDKSNAENQVIAKMQLVDLAGSERQSQTGNTGLAAKEAIDINKSLFCLRQVITSLAEQSRSSTSNKKSVASHIPYRDSKLTSLLKQSLGGNSFSLMVACLAPSDAFAEENVSTLNYATKASFIQNQPAQNVDPRQKLINDLRVRCAKLEQELDQANTHIQLLSDITDTKSLPNEKSSGEPTNSVDPRSESKLSSTQKPASTTTASRTAQQSDERSAFSQSSNRKQQAHQNQPSVASTPTTVSGSTESNSQVFHRLDAQTMSKKLVESVNMVKSLMATNTDMRHQLEEKQAVIDTHESDTFHLQMENRDARDRIEILESVVAASASVTEQFERMDWRAIIADELPLVPKGDNQAINHIVQLLFDLRKENLKFQETEQTMMTQNQDLKAELAVHQQKVASHQQVAKEMRAAHMSNPYHGGFDGSDGRDPFGGSIKQQNVHQRQAVGGNYGQPRNQDDALKMLTDMMNKRTQKKPQR